MLTTGQPGVSVCQFEDEHRATLRARGEYAFAGMPEEAWWGLESARDDGDILLAILLVGDRTLADPGPGVELPQFLAGFGIERLEPALDIAVEDKAAACRQGAAQERQLLFAAPDPLLTDRIPRHHFAHEATWTGLVEIERLVELERALLPFFLLTDEIHAEIEGRDVDQTGLRVIGHRLPVFAPEQVRADVLCPNVEPRPFFRDFDRAAGF